MTCRFITPIAFCLLAACSSAPEATSAEDEADTLADVAFTDNPRVSGAPKRLNAVAPETPGAVDYRGGPVIADAQIHLVLWGTDVPDDVALADFYRTVAGSPYLAWLREYDTPTQNIGSGSFAGSHVIHPAAVSGVVTDAAIQKELARQIATHKLPPPGGNVLYMVHFPRGVSVSSRLGESCTSYCAYHASFSKKGVPIYYGVAPDLGDCPRCLSYYSGAQLDALKALTAFASHEVLEAITDPGVSTGNYAWTGAQGEIGDLCEGAAADLDTLGAFTIEKGWSNAKAACISR